MPRCKQLCRPRYLRKGSSTFSLPCACAPCPLPLCRAIPTSASRSWLSQRHACPVPSLPPLTHHAPSISSHFRAQACSAAQAQSGAAQAGSMLAGFEYPEHVCGAPWRDEYVRLHARIRAASRDAWSARKPPDAPSFAPSCSPAPAPAPASHSVPPLASAPPPQPAAQRRRLADDSSPGEEAPAVRFLTYDWYGTCGGLGDYLIGLVSIFPVALLDRRALLIAQPCMHAAFHSPHIDTALSPDVPMGGHPLLRATPLDAQEGDERVEWHAPPCEQLEGNLSAAASNSSGVPCLNMAGQGFEIEALQQLSALRNYRMRYNHGLLISTLLLDQGPWATALRQLGFKVAYGFGCILRFLFSPRPEVWQLVVGMEEQVWGEGVVRVAVHVRVPDREVWHSEGMPLEASQQQVEELLATANTTLQCTQTVEDFWYPPPLKVKWIIITNSHPLKQALKAKYPHKVVATDFIPWHSAQATQHGHTHLASTDERDAALRGLQHFRETVAEWALIAACHSFIIPASGFSRTAALYGLRPLDIFMPAPDPCDPEQPTPIAALRGSWSGI
ncbi:unnamed protein product [Closterium sp. NIES-65]|nr:unnamed protein product [Closterium sp. NIES-65]